MLNFLHPDHFLGGNIHSCIENWRAILQDSPFQDFVLPIISHGVVISDYFQSFQGLFLRCFYDSNLPPRKIFPNSKSCASFEGFITDSIMERVRNGSLNVIGRVGEVEPPHLVLPITIEPKKPRMCHDERFLNLWIKDCPFTLDYITELPRYVDQVHYQTLFDDKSGYDHIQLHLSSSTYFVLEWGGGGGMVLLVRLFSLRLESQRVYLSYGGYGYNPLYQVQWCTVPSVY